jgi:HEPN domain-containing protein
MKSKADLVNGTIRKAESDLQVAKLCLSAGEALDIACFHAQQSAEKYLKAYLIAKDVDFPFIHNIEKLVELCAIHDSEFRQLESVGGLLTPFAVSSRYDEEFWPTLQVASEAIETAEIIKAFVLKRLD